MLLFVNYTLKVLEILCFELALWACISTNPRYVHDHQLLYHTAWEVKRSRHRVQISCTPSLVTQPAHPSRQEIVWWTKSNFLGLLPKCGKDLREWDQYIAPPYNSKICHLHSNIHSFFEQVVRKTFWTLLGYNVTKACTRPRNSTWFTRSFLLIRG